MKSRKYLTAGVISFACILLNIGCKALASALGLPLWLDNIGTVITAYIYGPVCGGVVGAATNIAFSITSPIRWVYGVTSAAVGVIVGLCAKKRWLDSLFGRLTTGFIVTLSSVIISTPLNLIVYGGHTGNKWGDGVADFLDSAGWNRVISCAVGEFYVDFADKLLTVFILSLLLRLYRRTGGKLTKKIFPGAFCALLGASLCLSFPRPEARADERTVNYNTYLHTVYNAENGLPGGTVNAIAQTGDGVLWIGTQGGLYRYSGTVFQPMNKFSSIKNVNCFCADEEGRLWVGTNDNGLSICINDSVSNVLTQKDGLPSDSVRCITENGGGVYYVGTPDALAVVSLTNGLGVDTVIPEIKHAKSISANSDYAAVVTEDGDQFFLRGAEVIDRVTGKKYTCCKYIGDHFYAGTANGTAELLDFSDNSWRVVAFVKCGGLLELNSLSRSETGEIMVCAENGAGYIDRGNKFYEIHLGKFNTSIEHTLFDYQGNLWFSSSRLGLLRLCISPFTEVFTQTGFDETVVNSVCKWQGRFWFGTDSGLLCADVTLTEKLSNELTDRLKRVRVRCLFTDSRDDLWIATTGEGALCCSPDGSVRVYGSETGAPTDKFRVISETRDGRILLAGDAGITVIKDGRITENIDENNGLANTKAQCLLETESGDILAGTDGGGIAVIRNGEAVLNIRKEEGLSSNVISRVVPDEDGYFVVTSSSLCYMDKEYNVRVLEKFPYYNNYDVVDRGDGMMFVLSSAGIYVIDRENLLGDCTDLTLLEYTKGLRVQLTANSFNYLDEHGDLFLCGTSGAVMLKLYDYSSNHRSYRMSVREIDVDGEAYRIMSGETIKLPRGADRVSITPDIVNYSISDPYVSVYLEGYDSEPSMMKLSELSTAVYTNIPTGSYTFRMAVYDDRWNITSESSYNIVKEKEIYDEWWFAVYLWSGFLATVLYLAWMIFRTQFQRAFNIQKRELEVAQKQVKMGNEAIMTIARTVDAKDPNTSQHSFRVSEYSVMIAEKLGMSEKQREELRMTALLHDIGKIGIPDSVLNKPAKLTDEEYGIMKTHVVKGAEILSNFTSIEKIVEGARYHHERYDGRGYMEGLKGEDIPLNARIIGIADAFDAMTANRVYRKQLDIEFVLSELKRCRGSQFDPHLTDIMLGLIDDGTIQVEKLYEESKQAAERRERR